MSRHEGVSCDACLKGNFRGRRYKCLICYDYDLCAACYEEGATSTSHSVEHPMQCILTRADFEIYYGGEPSNSEQPQSFTCPYCKKMGFSDTGLYDHVSAEHTDTGLEVVCPVCAAVPGGDPNLVTDDFSGHLTLEHRTGPRDLISFLDEPSAIRHGGVRRMPHSGRALGGPRPRRSNMHLSSSSGLSALSPSGRESVDPIAELLSQLSGVRRGNPPPSQLQQLQMQIQLERQQVSAARQQLERLPRRPQPVSSSSASNALNSGSAGASNGIGSTNHSSSNNNNSGRDITITSNPLLLAAAAAAASSSNSNLGSGSNANGSAMQSNTSNQSNPSNRFLLTRFTQPTLDESDLAQLERSRAERSQFVQSLLLSTLSLSDENDEQNNTLDDVAFHPEQICDDPANTVSLDSVTSNAPTARASEYEEAKKKQESASHSDLDSLPPHLSAPQAQQRSSSKPKTGSSKSNQSSANPQSTKPAREKVVSLPSDTR
ncbi:E3 ubiquitin-protein ligase Kcmf1 isoform X2 [Sitodiplosis mosellana]|uniref:E3 ubiquitin-protein ligase Kcmf1 isoform X2 n=1 Tax=Sitodiplosis mosellana TaxID=263140 RepID=UPI002445021F|nr:E3 ubiquitin-protein ligase Kcmf1 isoform X2 [Sitodiplosis mosellana]